MTISSTVGCSRVAISLLLVLLFLQPLRADDSEPSAADQRRERMIERVDSMLAERWKEQQIQAAENSSDSEFLRRVYLDLTGVIPRVAEARQFLENHDPDKRAQLIDRLLASPAFATHMANTWRRVMLPGTVDIAQRNNVIGVQNWLRSQFADNLRYDRMVGDLLVATGGGQTGPALYYTAMELEPEKLAGSTARIFLGMQIECAQCHPHPFDNWTQEDFWGYAAFFARLRQEAGGGTSLYEDESGEVTLPDTETVVGPRFPGGQRPKAEARGSRRVQLAIWMASRDNPFLARAAVNRVWAHLFGRGFVDPVDDFSERNPPSHPELLDELSQYFIATGFDLRELIRTVARTRAYQLSSRYQGDSPPPESFARMAIKTLNAEQLYDSLNRSLVRPRPGQNSSPLADPQRQAFVAQMESPSRNATEYQSGVPQALTLMNGNDIGQATNNQQGGLLAALDAPIFNDEERVRILFLATLTRWPQANESSKFLEYVSSGGTTGDSRQALGDVLWALMNSAEFALNH